MEACVLLDSAACPCAAAAACPCCSSSPFKGPEPQPAACPRGNSEVGGFRGKPRDISEVGGFRGKPRIQTHRLRGGGCKRNQAAATAMVVHAGTA